MTPPGATDISIAYNVSSRDEVDVVMEEARRAGAVIVKAAQNTFWDGYAGYFQDPDRHLWEIAWNPENLPGRLDSAPTPDRKWVDFFEFSRRGYGFARQATWCAGYYIVFARSRNLPFPTNISRVFSELYVLN